MNIKAAQDDGLYSLAIFLDLTKAFDCIDFDILLETLEGYGIKSTVLEWIRSYLTNKRCKILANGILLDSFDVTCVGPRYQFLDHYFFLIYVNELSADIPFAYIINFADDTVLFLTHKNREQLITNAEVCLHAATEFFEERLLSLNTKKTKYIIFKNRNGLVYNSKINTADHAEIERVDHIKYLGIIIDEKLDWAIHIRFLCMKLPRAVGILHRLKFIFPHKILLILYFSLFHSYFFYGTSIWDSNYKPEWKQVQILQNKAIRAIYKLEPLPSVLAFLIKL